MHDYYNKHHNITWNDEHEWIIFETENAKQLNHGRFMTWRIIVGSIKDSQHNLSNYKQLGPTIILYRVLMQLYNRYTQNNLPMVWTSRIKWHMMSQLWHFFLRSWGSNFLKHERSLTQACQAVFKNRHITYWISSTCHVSWRWISLPNTLWIRWRVICLI